MKKKYDLSVIITAKNEEFLSRTVSGVLKAKRADTEVIVVFDGNFANPPVEEHPDVTIIFNKESVGQRAGINQAVRLSDAEFIMKLDAHCIVSDGFDKILIEDGRKLGPKVTQVPRMYNLHAFNWKCKKCGNEWYQGPTPKECQNPGENKGKNKDCDSKEFERVIVWKPRFNRQSDSMRFDSDLHFQYWGSFKHRPEGRGDISDTMSLVGACFVMNRERYWELGGSDEEHGSWGQQGTEISCKTWLSGGRLVCNKRCWFSHLFRTQGKDFGFPYKHKPGAREKAVKYSKNLWRSNKWDKAVLPLNWLVEKFWPVPGWTEEDLKKIGGIVPEVNPDKKGIIYYTDNQLKLKIAKGVQKNLKSMNLPIVSASLKPMDFGKNVHVKLKRGYMTMFKQILSALEASEAEIVYFCEHDVLYHYSHFDFKPKKKDVWYYNTNVIKVNTATGQTVKVDDCKQVSGICVYRDTAIKHYKKRIKLLEKFYSGELLSECCQAEFDAFGFSKDDGLYQEKCLKCNKACEVNWMVPKEEEFNRYIRAMGFEPGTHNRAERVDDATSESWKSEYPNIDIRHENNLTSSRWRKEQFRNAKYTKGWREGIAQDISGWEKLIHNFYLIH